MSPLPGAPRGNAPPRGRPAAPAQRVRHALAALLLAVLTLVGGTPAAVGAVPTVRGLTAQALSTTQAPSAAPSPFGTWPSSAGQVPAPHGPVLVPARDLRSGQVGEAQAAGTAAASLPSTPRTAEADLRISPASPACAGLSAAPPPGPRETRGSPCPPRPHLSASPVPTSSASAVPLGVGSAADTARLPGGPAGAWAEAVSAPSGWWTGTSAPGPRAGADRSHAPQPVPPPGAGVLAPRPFALPVPRALLGGAGGPALLASGRSRAALPGVRGPPGGTAGHPADHRSCSTDPSYRLR
ncbi:MULTISPECIES: hypothetical protein [unclassified Streptomyces]|uniref:hypothetical protein n=1 Tax=unclassified Streptomyces TaxID=2593676 RepID=UPI0001C1A7FE|nr:MULTISPECIES: hypothetical protein [unclassified Streptomyces]AEN13511.1 conserved hypothetical protein [Streptomyces sp. SirexAA-E]MYT67041.1 hypothetical protein [Streptomyces sp. SID8357]MYT84685.1 hypothetical protein [Streptomyces sp. SID8360]MYW40963.1 hypothetical protein [Streptomyces sp. SID1]PZX34996.1 hypothetical protein K373_04982 [Streptomyces sp. DvalAA-21]